MSSQKFQALSGKADPPDFTLEKYEERLGICLPMDKFCHFFIFHHIYKHLVIIWGMTSFFAVGKQVCNKTAKNMKNVINVAVYDLLCSSHPSITPVKHCT